jgi:hypothetical protein
MSRRPIPVLIFVAALAAGLLVAGCSRTVRVETGERIVCSYGEVVTDTVHAIDVPADQATKYKVVNETITCDRHRALESLYADAQAAITAGDLNTAGAKLAEIVKTEPQFKNAQQQLDAISEGRTPAVDTTFVKSPGSTTTTSTTSNPGGTPSPDKQPVGPVATLSTWVPATLSGYTSGPIIADVYTLTRDYVPAKSKPTDALVIVVEQYKDATAARAAIKNDLGHNYPTDPSNATVSGRAVYFGTDGHRLAIVAWNENGVVVAIEGSSKTGTPAALKTHLTSLVAAIVK